MNAPNKYDLRFLAWYNHHGWRMFLDLTGPVIWTHGDAVNPFKVTVGMIRRLEAANLIARIYPAESAIWEEYFQPVKNAQLAIAL